MADPVGLIYAAARRHRRELLQNERSAASQMVRYYGQSWQRIQAQLADFQRRIAEAKAAGEDVSPSWLFQLGRLETLRAQVEAEIGRFAQYAENSIVAQQRQAVEAAQRHALDWTTTVPGVAVEWNRLPTGAMEDLVGFLSNRSPLRELLDELPRDAGQSVADALVTGLATGQNPRSTARLIRQALGGNLARALTISRTETLRAYREATRRSYLANRDVLRGWVWHSALDKRTCACCWAMHGSVHKLSENLDDHPNGRCAMVPLIKDWPNPDIEAGADVFARQPEEVQRAVLGDAGLEAYRAGAVTLGDYVGQTRSREWGTMRSARSLTAILGQTEARRWRQASRVRSSVPFLTWEDPELRQVLPTSLGEFIPPDRRVLAVPANVREKVAERHPDDAAMLAQLGRLIHGWECAGRSPSGGDRVEIYGRLDGMWHTAVLAVDEGAGVSVLSTFHRVYERRVEARLSSGRITRRAGTK